jgi:hypothetical protein
MSKMEHPLPISQPNVLLEEYKEKMELFRHSLTLVLNFFIAYLAITGVAIGYALSEEIDFSTKLALGGFDLASGAWGLIYLLCSLPYMKRLDKRLEKISNFLGIQHQGTSPFTIGIYFLIVFYVFTCLGWLMVLAF